MTLDEYAQYDALALGELVNKGEISAHELANAAMQAVQKVNPSINAVIETYSDRVEGADALARPGLFRGVPFFLKDYGASEAGRPQEFGSRLARGNIATVDSHLTEHFRDAGLVILGRTTAPEFALTATTESLLHGATRNPWDPSLTAGGSSGGAAAAVASGIVPVAHGTDSGGSIRIPAACCGLVGLKTSRGRNSLGPAADEEIFGYGVEHVISRSVRDSAVMLDYTSKPMSGDPFDISRPMRTYREEINLPPGPLRLAYVTPPCVGAPIDAEIAAAVEDTARVCAGLGLRVDPVAPDFGWESYLTIGPKIFVSAVSVFADALAARSGHRVSPETLEPVTFSAYQEAKIMKASELLEAISGLNALRRRVGSFFESFDVLLTPTLATPPWPLGTLSLDLSIAPGELWQRFDQFCPHLELFNVTGQPAISLPLAQSSSGIPIGLQLVARFGDEAAILRLACALEQARPWAHRKPPIHVVSPQ